MDGGTLYLKIDPDGSRCWVFMYILDGKQREMGLGSASKGGLADARYLWEANKDDCKTISPVMFSFHASLIKLAHGTLVTNGLAKSLQLSSCYVGDVPFMAGNPLSHHLVDA